MSEYSAAVLAESSLVGYWGCHELSGTTITDLSAGGHDLTLAGGYTLGVPGPGPAGAPTAVSFDGSTGYAQAASTTIGNTTGFAGVSIEHWHKIYVYSNSGAFWSKRLVFYDTMNAFWGTEGYEPDFFDGTTRKGQVFGGGLDMGWHHIIVTYDPSNGNTRWFFDGQDGGTWGATSGGLGSNATPLVLGCQWDGTTRSGFFNGAGCDYALYNQILTPTQALAHYNARINGQGTYQASAGIPTGVYGDGHDGAVTFDGTATFGFASTTGSAPNRVYTLTRDLYASVLNVSSGITVNTGGYRVFASVSATITGTLQHNGGNASGITNGTAAASPLWGASGAGGVGFNGGGGSATNSQGAPGGGGGFGVGANSGFEAAQGTAVAPVGGVRRAAPELLNPGLLTQGNATGLSGGSGGGAGSSAGSNSGAGGGGGGIVVLAAATVTVGGAGAIKANGGSGGTGGATGIGGGGGGGGGAIHVVCGSYSNSGTVQAAAGAGGASGGGGATAGSAGSAGNVITVISGTVGGMAADAGAGNAMYGDGSDGVVAMDGTNTFAAFATKASTVYTLTRDVYATTLTVTGATLITAGFRVYATVSVTSSGTIHCDGVNGSGTTGGASRGPGSLAAGGNAGNGGAIGANNGGNGGATTTSHGGSGGAGGNSSGSGPFGTNGTGGTATAPGAVRRAAWHLLLAWSLSVGLTGGGGGGGGGASGGGASGGGGGGGGVLVISSPAIANTGRISANGGVGADGSFSNGGGGGGGGGGAVHLVYGVYTGSAAQANGGTGGAGPGGGHAGVDGSAGKVILAVNV